MPSRPFYGHVRASGRIYISMTIYDQVCQLYHPGIVAF